MKYLIGDVPFRPRGKSQKPARTARQERGKGNPAPAPQNPATAAPALSTAEIGTIAELQVSLDLMQRGYSVFLAISPVRPFNLAIHHGGRFLAVRSRAAKRNRGGTLVFPPESPQTAVDLIGAWIREESRVEYIGISPRGKQFVRILENPDSNLVLTL